MKSCTMSLLKEFCEYLFWLKLQGPGSSLGPSRVNKEQSSYLILGCWDHALCMSLFQITGYSQHVVPVDPMAPHRANATMPTGTPTSV